MQQTKERSVYVCPFSRFSVYLVVLILLFWVQFMVLQ